MALTKLEKIADIQKQIEQLKNQQKLYQQQHNEQERKARTRRLCSRGGYIESRLPETITLTDEQFKSFLEKTLFADYTRKILTGFTKQNAETVSGISKTAAQVNNTIIKEPLPIEVEYDEDSDEYEDAE